MIKVKNKTNLFSVLKLRLVKADFNIVLFVSVNNIARTPE